MQLVDITSKIKVQRCKRILKLINTSNDTIQRFLADSLIGKCSKYGHEGLSFGTLGNRDRIKSVKHDYYKFALNSTNSLNLTIKPGNLKLIEHEPLFYNQMFLDENFLTFTILRFNNTIPKMVKDIRNLVHIGESENSAKIQKIRRCIYNVETTNKTTN